VDMNRHLKYTPNIFQSRGKGKEVHILGPRA
jgi:hypothetical protein